MRKGFTLIELLIVIAIIGALSATMMLATKGATAKAKAAAIATNVHQCENAAAMYFSTHEGENMNSTGADEVLATLPIWDDINGTDEVIKYTATGNGPNNWVLKVDFTKDSDVEDIKTALARIRGFGVYDKSTSRVASGKFKVTLLECKVEADTE